MLPERGERLDAAFSFDGIEGGSSATACLTAAASGGSIILAQTEAAVPS